MSVTGVEVGFLLGTVAAWIAYRQQRSQWVGQGFARARTVSEKKLITRYTLLQKTSAQTTTKKVMSRWLFPIISAVILLANLHLSLNFVLSLCFSFVASFLGLYILIASTVDGKIRAEHKRHRN